MIVVRRLRQIGLACVAALSFAVALPASGEVSEVRISHGYGVLYLPLVVMASEKLVEKHAAAAGLPDVKSLQLVHALPGS